MTITTNSTIARYREDGIMNGAGGYIDYIQTSSTKSGSFSKKDPDFVEVIWFKFHNQTVGKKCYKGNVKKDTNLIHHQSYPFIIL